MRENQVSKRRICADYRMRMTKTVNGYIIDKVLSHNASLNKIVCRIYGKGGLYNEAS